MLQVELMPQAQGWSVLCSAQKHNLFIETDLDKNVFGSYYHIREPQTQQLHMTFAEYAQCATTWTTKKVMFKVCLSCNLAPASKLHIPRKAREGCACLVHLLSTALEHMA